MDEDDLPLMRQHRYNFIEVLVAPGEVRPVHEGCIWNLKPSGDVVADQIVCSDPLRGTTTRPPSPNTADFWCLVCGGAIYRLVRTNPS